MTEPSYLLNGIPLYLRRAIAAEAADRDLSLADTIREALCGHYGLDCPPKGRGYNPTRDMGSPQLLVRASHELFAAIKADAEARDETMRTVILKTLEDHFDLEVSA